VGEVGTAAPNQLRGLARLKESIGRLAVEARTGDDHLETATAAWPRRNCQRLIARPPARTMDHAFLRFRGTFGRRHSFGRLT
jgi:hypothetical protein